MPCSAAFACVPRFVPFILAAATGLALAAEARAQTGVSDDRVSLPDGPGSLDGVGDNAAVNPNMGLFSTSVPFDLPQGFPEATPSLGLQYSSGAGSSPVGIGWSMPIPFVERMTAKGLPIYDDTDHFVADGSDELVRVTDGEPQVFRARFENAFVRWSWFDREGGDEGYWLAEAPDGGKSYFGADTSGAAVESARVRSPNGVFRWLLVAQMDRFGHEVRYDYTLYGSVPLLDQVSWAFSSTNTPRYTVLFDYEARQDLISDCRGGFNELLGHRLSAVHAFVGNAVLRRWALTYEDYAASGGFSRLAGVQRYGKDDGAYPVSSIFNYSRALGGVCDGIACEAPYLVDMGNLGVSLGARQANLIDINGDGLPDVVDTVNLGQMRIRMNVLDADGSQSFAPAVSSAVGDSSGYPLDSPKVQMLDYDGDGFADLVNTGTGRVLVNKGLGDWAADQAIVGSGTGALPDFSVDFSLDTDGELSHVRFMDYDGDRKIDVVQSDLTTTQIFQNLGNGGFVQATGVDAIGAAFADGRLELADMNGDGLLDPVLVSAGQIGYRLNLGFGKWSAWVDITDLPFTSPTDLDAIELDDINGDGIDDVVVVTTGLVRYSINRNGDHFDPVESISSAGGAGLPPRDATTTVLFADMNGNGSNDVVWITADGAVTFLELFPVRPNLLSRIENGIGLVTEVQYGSAAQQRANADGVGWSDPMPNAMLVVESLDTYAAAALPQDVLHEVSTYDYSGGFYDGAEKRFAGFRHVEEARVGDEGQETATIVRDYDVGAGVDRSHMRGLEIENALLGESGPIKKVARVYDLCPLDGVPVTTPPIRWVCLLAETTTMQDGAPSTEWKDVRNEFEYDGYGNTMLTSRLGVIDVTGDEQFDETTYVLPSATGGRWILGATAVERSYTSVGGRARETRTYYDGAPFEGLPLGLLTLGLATRVEADVDEAGAVVQTERTRYNADGSVVETIAPNGGLASASHRQQYTFDATGLFVVETARTNADATGDYKLRRAYTYDPLFDRPTSSTRWFVDGAPSAEDDRSFYGYDEHGRISYMVKPGGDTAQNPTERYSYAFTSPISRVLIEGKTSPGGAFDLEEIRCIDGFGRVVQQRRKLAADKYEVSGFKVFNRRGEVRKLFQPFTSTSGACESQPTGVKAIELEFDAAGREIKAIEPDADDFGTASVRETRYEPLRIVRYDEDDSDAASPFADTPFVVEKDGLDRPTRAERLLSATASDALVYRFEYDDLGDLSAIIDPENNAKRQTRDLLGRIVEVDDPDSGKTTNVLDDSGNVIESTDARGVVVKRTYDAFDRETAEWDDAREVETKVERFYDRSTTCKADYCKNAAGELLGARYPVFDGTGEDWFTFDARGRLVKASRSLLGNDYELRNDYDGADRLVGKGFPGGRDITLQRDGADRIIGIPGFIPTVEYDARGMLAKFDYENGVANTRGYDARMRVNAVAAKSGATDLVGLAVTRDRVGDVLQVADAVGDGASSGSAELTYDAVKRLLSASLDKGGASAETMTFAYGALDELVEKSSSKGETSIAHVGVIDYDGASPRAATQAGELGLDYDAIGAMTARGDVSLENDHLGRLMKATRSGSDVGRYAYGTEADDRVIVEDDGSLTIVVAPGFEVRDGVSRILIGLGDTPLVELETLDLVTDVLSDIVPNGTIDAGDAFVAGLDGGTSTSDPRALLRSSARRLLLDDGEAKTYRHVDHLDSTIAVTNDAGALVERIAYFPHGEVRGATAVNTEMVAFTGKEADSATGLYFFGARYYDAHLGRFTSPDPTFRTVDSDPTEELLNLVMGYAYAGNAPASNIDPDGRLFGLPGAGGIVRAGVMIGIGAAIGVLSFGAANIVGAVAGGIVGAFTGIARVIMEDQDAERAGRPGRSALSALGTILGNIVSGAAEGLITGGVSAIANAASTAGEIGVRAASSEANIGRNVNIYKAVTGIGGLAFTGGTAGISGIAKVLPSVPRVAATLGGLSIKAGKALGAKAKAAYKTSKAAAKAKPKAVARQGASRNLKAAAGKGGK